MLSIHQACRDSRYESEIRKYAIVEYGELLQLSKKYLDAITTAHQINKNLDGIEWNVDQISEEIVFTFSDRIMKSDVQFIGTFNQDDSTWLWSWDNLSVQPSLTMAATKVREYAMSHAIKELTTNKFEIPEKDCWQFATIACYLSNGQGVFRGKVGATWLFLVFGDLQVSSVAPVDQKYYVKQQVQHVTQKEEVPEQVISQVRGFIQELHDWEVVTEKGLRGSLSSHDVKASYTSLIRNWCMPNRSPKAVSVSKPPKHDIKTELIKSVVFSAGAWHVRTQHIDPNGLATDYEYNLRLVEDEWLIDNFYFVDGAEKSPFL